MSHGSKDWRAPLTPWMVLTVVIALTIVVSITVRIVRSQTAAPGDTAQTGQRLAASPEAVIQAWAQAAETRDYETALGLMTYAPGSFEAALWQEDNERQITEGWFGPGPQVIVLQEQPYTARLRWEKATPDQYGPVCTTVQVASSGKLMVLDSFHWCDAKKGE